MAFHVFAGSRETPIVPVIRHIDTSDVLAALRRGLDDFRHKPSHYIFLCMIYPVVGVVLMAATSGENAFQLVFPLMAGFALIGPFAAIGLYEISRRREAGEDASLRDALAVLRSPAIPSILTVGAMLVFLFIAWIYSAEAIYRWTFGGFTPETIGAFLGAVFTTQAGWTLIVAGNLVGLAFALVALSTTVIAFPLMIDRDVGAYAAVATSARAVMANPGPMLLWGLIVAGGLALGASLFFAGLAVVMPILGHATWHLYRRVVADPIEARYR
ncbi:DUF2189 domain-containing protein [Pararhizobium haloflavum]|uniref:DUF2189 domain-containing protein n=1 Tax=Pararhizobium haloflavum TaxID=2037914 RepID=UPI000C18609F|nr:DUF2189 domain-containing protein [Pararhizobium haloflavum]